LTEDLSKQGVSRRLVDQITASGTSVGANLFEADEAMSRPDFVRCLCISIKELNESRFWLRLCTRRRWSSSDRTAVLIDESDQLRRILGAMVARTKRIDKKAPVSLSVKK